MVFCNIDIDAFLGGDIIVTILILIDGFLQSDIGKFDTMMYNEVTILILIDGFLQLQWKT